MGGRSSEIADQLGESINTVASQIPLRDRKDFADSWERSRT